MPFEIRTTKTVKKSLNKPDFPKHLSFEEDIQRANEEMELDQADSKSPHYEVALQSQEKTAPNVGAVAQSQLVGKGYKHFKGS